jgi:hypothetical protein
MWTKLLILITLLAINSCNVASIVTGTDETQLGDNFQKDVTNGLLHFWKLDEGLNSNRADKSGILNLTDTASVNKDSSGGRGGGADCSTGSSGSGFLQNNSASGFIYDYSSKHYSFSFWVKPQTGTPSTDYYILDQGATHIYFQFLAGPVMDLYFSFNSGTFSISSIVSSADFNNWQHFVITVDPFAPRAYVYKNGNYFSDTAITTSSGGNANISLCSVDDGTSGFNGSLDSFGIWDRVLGSDEIQSLYNGNNNVD